MKIEREILKEPGGKQDQYATAYGGVALYQFNPDDSVLVRPLAMGKEKREELEKRLLLLFTGVERSSGSIHEVQDASVADHLEGYQRVREYAYSAYDLLSEGDYEGLGKLMGENWAVKRTFAPGITNPQIDAIYERAIKAGALGGKLQGAGGGGFMLFLVPPDKRAEVLKALSDYRVEEVKVDPFGARVAYAEDWRTGPLTQLTFIFRWPFPPFSLGPESIYRPPCRKQNAQRVKRERAFPGRDWACLVKLGSAWFTRR